MEFQQIELTSEDLLGFHRYYITRLYLEEKKTDVEIVQYLYEKYKFQVTLQQIQKCIRDWRLELPISPELKPEDPTEPATPSDDSWVVIPSASAAQTQPASAANSYPPSDPKLMLDYTKRPLPALPTSKSNTKVDTKSRVRKRQTPNTDRVRGICHHGTGSSDSHEVETTLSSVPVGPTQMELYVDDDQDYERVAQGLRSTSFDFARSGQFREGAARHHSAPRVAKRPNSTSKEKRNKGKGKETERLRSLSDEPSEREMSHES